jgi:hypothetical protein
LANQENTPEEVLMSMHLAVTAGIDRLFIIAFDTYADKIDDHSSIYRLFVGILAQTIGRHIAGFPEGERSLIENEALSLQEEMTKITVQAIEDRKKEINKQHTVSDSRYDLINMKPAGNA